MRPGSIFADATLGCDARLRRPTAKLGHNEHTCHRGGVQCGGFGATCTIEEERPWCVREDARGEIPFENVTGAVYAPGRTDPL